MSGRRRALLGVVLAMAVPASAAAQAVPARPPRTELALGGTFTVPASVGSSSANLLTPSGSNLKLFDVKSRMGPGYGGDVALGVHLGGGIWIEGLGAVARTSARTRISADVEAADGLTVTSALTRVSAEGGVRVQFHDRGATSWFVRGSGGWMREIAAGNSLADDGLIASAGGGVQHWWRRNGAGSVKQMGLRLEGRLVMRSSGIAFGSDSVHFAPAASGAIVMRF